MLIHQVQATYQVEQDRILVRLNTHTAAEFRLWLTRRMVKKLFPNIIQASEELIAPQAQPTDSSDLDQQAASAIKKKEALQQADFTTPYSADAQILPIGSEPLLATTVYITPDATGSLRLRFEEKTPDTVMPRNFEVTLGPALLIAFLHLMESVLKHTDWGISLGDPEKLKNISPEDIFAAAKPPYYLN